ncbi:MAG TPA: ASCH domain-containing protein [Brumimicrobium sp.]|nr:ASCH domain-containing protein [Brumimicrobium sp.]
MQRLTLYEDVFDALKKGKLTTIRKGRRDIALGMLLFESTDTKRKQIVEVIMVYYTRLENVNTEDVKNDGFNDHLDMWEKMKIFYPSIELEDEVTVVKFR